MINRAPEQCNIDVPQVMFSHIRQSTVRAEIVATESGIVAGVDILERQARALGLQTNVNITPGSEIHPGSIIATISGEPVQIVRGEDLLLGTIGKASGVATAARTAVSKAGHIRVVCGGWKKMPIKMKDDLRDALKVGGVDIRILPEPFLYLDKNYVRILGSLGRTLEKATILSRRTIAIQLRGETGLIAEEALTAARYGAQVLMVDTGCIRDLREVSAALRREGLRERVELAFAGNLNLDELENLQNEDLDTVDIGRVILDAPLLDFRYDVVKTKVNEDGTTLSGKN